MQGFFNVPVDNLFSEPTIAKYIKENIPDYTNGIVVSKNAGGAMRVTSLADQLGLPFALIEKKTDTKATVIGDVKEKNCFIMVNFFFFFFFLKEKNNNNIINCLIIIYFIILCILTFI